MKKGYDERTGLYSSRYYANKAKGHTDVVIKVEGGFAIINVIDYKAQKNQK